MNTQATGEIRPKSDNLTFLRSHKLERQKQASRHNAYQAMVAMFDNFTEGFSIFRFQESLPEGINTLDCALAITHANALIDAIKEFRKWATFIPTDEAFQMLAKVMPSIEADVIRPESNTQARPQNPVEATKFSSGYTDEPHKVSLDEVLAQQAIERGIEPMPLEADLLIQRIEQGGHSGQFLADAFLCAYRPNWFNHSLMEVTKLDAEAFRLFHQILHIRHVSGWSDESLYQIEKRVIAAMEKIGGVA